MAFLNIMIPGGLAGLIVRPSLKNRGTPQVRAPPIRAKGHHEPPLEGFPDRVGWDGRTAHCGRITSMHLPRNLNPAPTRLLPRE